MGLIENVSTVVHLYERERGEWERGGGERDRQTDRQTDRDRDTERGRERQADTETDTQRDRDTVTDRERETDRQTDTQTQRETERDRERLRQRQREKINEECECWLFASQSLAMTFRSVSRVPVFYYFVRHQCRSFPQQKGTGINSSKSVSLLLISCIINEESGSWKSEKGGNGFHFTYVRSKSFSAKSITAGSVSKHAKG